MPIYEIIGVWRCSTFPFDVNLCNINCAFSVPRLCSFGWPIMSRSILCGVSALIIGVWKCTISLLPTIHPRPVNWVNELPKTPHHKPEQVLTLCRRGHFSHDFTDYRTLSNRILPTWTIPTLTLPNPPGHKPPIPINLRRWSLEMEKSFISHFIMDVITYPCWD